jgi:UDP-N-acetylmuramate--alanine ligase
MDKKIHLMGIGGSGMSGVALLAEASGYEVSGCDIEKNSAYAKNISVGHSKSHVAGSDLIIVSPAIYFQDENNEEVLEAKKQNKLVTWQEFTGKVLAKDKKVICIAGTHGKSTVTAMAGKLLEDAGLDPTVLVGARVPEWKGNARAGKGDYFIIEADEFNDNFLNYSPEIIVLNNIEFDHPDYFKSEEEVFESFKKFVKKLKGIKTLVVNKDSEGIQKLLKSTDTDAINVIEFSGKTDELGFTLKVSGKHNIENALGVVALGKLLEINSKTIESSLSTFKGIGRRMEFLGKKSGVEIYDDYAHHPTAIKATLQALRESHPKARIWAIDEPHGFSRTHALLPLYKDVFIDAEKVLIGPIFKARDKETFGMTPSLVAETSGHDDAKGFDSFGEIKKILLDEVKSGDVIIVMGAGKSYLWAREVVDMLPISFKDLTTFGIGGGIKKYYEVKSKDEVTSAADYAKKNNLPVFIIGGGSDILVNDEDFGGVVIKFVGENFDFKDMESNKVQITAEAGMEWDKLVEEAVKKNLQGIECLSGIPGKVGAAPIQNIGAYGQELKNTFTSLSAFDIEKNKFVEFNNKDCKFGYRESVFKDPKHWQKFIITDITLELAKNGKPEVKYDSLKNYLTEKDIKDPTLEEVRDAVLTIRAGKFENPKVAGNAGSFFKNPILSKSDVDRLCKDFPDIPARPQEDGSFKGSAGWFIEKAGWKGKEYKNAGVSKKHALILINPEGKATAKEILELSDNIIKDVKDKFGVTLEREVQLINFK